MSTDLFPWHDSFDTGFAAVDEQHKQWARWLNRLAGEITCGVEPADLTQLVDQLSDYAVRHFETEEAIWHAWLAGDASENEHRALHQSFCEGVDRLRSTLGAGLTPEAAGKSGQLQVVLTGCSFADTELLPALSAHGRFVDQEVT